MSQVLLLNASYEPLNICSWKRAVVLLMKGKAVEVDSDAGQKTIPTADSGELNLPLVIRLLYYVKIPHKDIPLTRKNVMHRDKYTCQYCGKGSQLTIDHVMPRSRGGTNTWDNVVVACLQCNVRKGNKTPKEAGMPLPHPPKRPRDFLNFELSKQHYIVQKHTGEWRKYLQFMVANISKQ